MPNGIIIVPTTVLVPLLFGLRLCFLRKKLTRVRVCVWWYADLRLKGGTLCINALVGSVPFNPVA